jgi:hypothetical protein
MVWRARTSLNGKWVSNAGGRKPENSKDLIPKAAWLLFLLSQWVLVLFSSSIAIYGAPNYIEICVEATQMMPLLDDGYL